MKNSEIYTRLCKDMDRDIKWYSEYFKGHGIFPTDKVINNSKSLLYEILHHNIYPEDISTSDEGGICLTFRIKNKRMFLELYNDGEIGYIVENIKDKKLIENDTLHSINQSKDKIINFYS